MSLRRMMNVTASTKRSPALTAGKRGLPATHLTALRCTPVDPANGQGAQDLALRLGDSLKQGFRIMETFTEPGQDLIDGDVLITNGREYVIRQVNEWAWRGSSFMHLLMEDNRP